MLKKQPILISRCSGSKKLRQQSQLTKFWTSRSIVARTDFPDYEMLDAMIASALKKLLDNHVQIRRRVSVEQQRAQKYDRVLRERQIAYLICKHFRATGAFDAVRGLSDLINTRLQNQQVKHLQKLSWKGCTSQNCRILFSFRLYWLCTTKELHETIGN